MASLWIGGLGGPELNEYFISGIMRDHGYPSRAPLQDYIQGCEMIGADTLAGAGVIPGWLDSPISLPNIKVDIKQDGPRVETTVETEKGTLTALQVFDENARDAVSSETYSFRAKRL